MTDAFSSPAAAGDDEVSGVDPDVLAGLVRAASQGDRDAAGEYFAHMLPTLTITAKRVAGASHDADDLLGDALLVVLSKWSEGTGPTDNVPAYIAQTMRNRIRDDFRSPRSKVAALDVVEEPASKADPRIRELEIESELAVVRRALGELPDDQQRVLVATVLEGMKPRDLEEHLDRPASAIYSLSRRARANLRRTTLRLLLEENARPECVAAAQLLPDSVGDSAEQTKAGRSSDHYRTCPYCRRSWKRFAGLATLGVLPVAGAVAVAGPAGTAEASEVPMTDAPADVPADASTPSADGLTGAANPAWQHAAKVITMLAASVTAVMLMTVITVAFFTKTWIFSEAPPADVDVVATAVDPGSSQFDVDFAVEGQSWSIDTLRIELSVPVDAVAPPEGWDCAVDGQLVTCTTDLIAPHGGAFVIEHAANDQVIDFAVAVEAIAERGSKVRTTYSDDLSR